MSEQDIRDERLKKLEVLKAAGMEAYPTDSHRDMNNAAVVAQFDELEKSQQKIHIGGRIMSLRGQGGIMFADVFDGTGRLQFVLQQAEMDESLFTLFSNAVDIGDFIEASGTTFKTKRGERSLKVQKWRMLAKALLPIPTEHFGLKDEELILRQRYLDILLNEEVRKMFVRRAKFWQSARDFYLARGFLEVETPVLETMPGGADARPFKTHHHALDIDVYLRISCGELWQKKLLVAGFPKVFEIGRIFRNEGQSREHLQDYTQLESYEAYADANVGMEFVRELYRHIAKETYGKYTFEIGEHTVDLAEDWQTIDFCAVLKERFGIDPLSCTEEEAIQAAKEAGVQFGESPNKSRAVDHLWKLIRKTIGGPAFLTGVPVYLEPLAKRVADNENVVDRIQVILAGSEMGKGYSELNDPQDQRARFEEQQKLRDAGDDEAQRLDLEYVRALEYGMPPAFGFGVSERLFSFLENRPAHEAQIFPLLRPKV
ncbi:lysine--tRNA ligase [Candidatus Kaiserbacteria bacterium RIFCSPHIGHO2_02_FULL_54_11b]|uniref:Lysine--tRNA ligase n=1 Tax=Candidatus Kaiserbacteria bacterium RIFCSPHIGHO2_02_FULL_54_11b TaxID=1798494 RepID=A0A1F6DRF7_9BACT|nr:MAG: lysine--tRNA ligase [Candidatus Kaiserbacteria bacterium RIFCSPHIGHO2_02_FULL_54_11b]